MVLFLMGVSLLLLLLADNSLKADIRNLPIFDTEALVDDYYNTKIGLYYVYSVVSIVVFFFGAGLILSIFHVFTRRCKSRPEIMLMFYFALLVNVFSGIFTGLHILGHTQGWFVIFPACNILNGAILLFSCNFQTTGERSISNSNTSIWLVLLGMLNVVLLFILCKYVLELYWAVTFSICVIYASNINNAVQRLLLPFLALHQTPQDHFRVACRKAIVDGELTLEEKQELTTLAKSLGISREVAKQLFDSEVKGAASGR
jgi:hypothetical protein